MRGVREELGSLVGQFFSVTIFIFQILFSNSRETVEIFFPGKKRATNCGVCEELVSLVGTFVCACMCVCKCKGVCACV